jgi:hypothetical protein
MGEASAAAGFMGVATLASAGALFSCPLSDVIRAASPDPEGVVGRAVEDGGFAWNSRSCGGEERCGIATVFA